MFEHSVKVPRLYKTAAKIAERVRLHGESVKQVYDDKLKHRNVKALYALIVSTVQNDSNLDFLLKKSELLRAEARLDPWLAKVLITELLWGKKRLPGQSKPVQTILAYEQIFNAHLSELEQPRNIKNKVDKPRYVRINTLKMTVHEAIDAFRDEGWILVQHLDKSDYPGFLSRISSLEDSEFMVDLHLPYLLIFPPRTQFYNHNAYRDGLIALQDKASCLPAHILAPPEDSKVLDMCAAPGMKTTQLSCIINGSGVIYAVERDLKRAQVLCSMIETAGAIDCVRVVERDVLDVCKRRSGFVVDGETFKQADEEEAAATLKDEDDVYRDVEYILVDPSCSGSGMVDGPETLLGNFQADPNRLRKLAGFQIMILKHALRAFPSAKRVVYSTCSLNVEENEEVVKEVLQSAQNFKLVDAKTLCQPWMNFGSGDVGQFCLYSKPDQDLTSGFFVAVFDRLESGEENTFLLQKGFKTHFKADKYNDDEEEVKTNKYEERCECLTQAGANCGEIGRKTTRRMSLGGGQTSDVINDKKSMKNKAKKQSDEGEEQGHEEAKQRKSKKERRKQEVEEVIRNDEEMVILESSQESGGKIKRKEKKKKNEGREDAETAVVEESECGVKINKDKRKKRKKRKVEDDEENVECAIKSKNKKDKA